MTPRLTARQLEIFIAAAESLSFARVAERLRLTPAAVSFQIRQIEAQTGFAVFERIGRRVALTEAGRVLLEYARPVLRDLGELDQAMLGLKGVSEGRVTLGLVTTAKYIVPHMIARFRRRFPGVVVRLRDANRSEIFAELKAGEIDIAFVGQPPGGAGITGTRLAAHPSVVIAHAGHYLRRFETIPVEALAPEWFVMREEGSGTRALAEEFFRAAGFAPRVAMETSSNEMVKQSVMAGIGIAIASRHTFLLERILGLLEVLPVTGFPVMRAWFLAQRQGQVLLPAHAALRDFLVRQAQTIIDELEVRRLPDILTSERSAGPEAAQGEVR